MDASRAAKIFMTSIISIGLAVFTVARLRRNSAVTGAISSASSEATITSSIEPSSPLPGPVSPRCSESTDSTIEESAPSVTPIEETEDEFLHDLCEECGNDYELHNHKDALFIFLLSPDCNHIEAICPHCGHEKEIFLEPEVVLYVLNNARLSIKLALQASEAFQAVADEYNGQMSDADLPEPVAPDRELTNRELRELNNDIRKLEHGEE